MLLHYSYARLHRVRSIVSGADGAAPSKTFASTNWRVLLRQNLFLLRNLQPPEIPTNSAISNCKWYNTPLF